VSQPGQSRYHHTHGEADEEGSKKMSLIQGNSFQDKLRPAGQSPFGTKEKVYEI
jgi:hypothetical protein